MLGHVQRETQQDQDHVCPHQHQAQPHQQEQPQHQEAQLHECPRQGTVSGVFDWTVPTVEVANDESLGGHVRDDGQQAGGQQEDDVRVGQGHEEIVKM